MKNETLTKRVIGILRQPGISKIGFNLNGLVVTGDGYARVAAAIAEGRIECRVVDEYEPQAELAAGMTVEARYSIDSDALLFRREDYGAAKVLEETSIVHEATHAIFDLGAKSKTDMKLSIDDEAAAVLAEALYIKLCDKKQGNFTMVIDGPQYEAMKLANSMIAETGGFTRGPKPYLLKRSQTQKLCDATAKDWNFKITVEANGDIYDTTGSKYVYNGVVRCKKGPTCR